MSEELPPARVTRGRRLQLNPQPLRLRTTEPAPPVPPAEWAELRAAARHRSHRPHDNDACPYKEEHS